MTAPAIVLLRPELSADTDVAVCRACGWQPLVASTVRLEADNAALAALSNQSRQADVLFWVSPGAVTLAANLVDKSSTQQHVAVGSATAEKLRQHGFGHVFCPTDGHDSEAVLRLLLWRERTGRLLIVGGEGGRQLLADSVRALGWQVDVAAVYHRDAVPIDWLAIVPLVNAGCLKAVYATTAAAADAWFSQMPTALHTSLKSLLYLTHHPRVAAALARHDVAATAVASLRDGLLSFH